MSDISNLSDTIVAKSDQLNADDLVGMDKTIVVTGVSRGNAENPLVINYQGDDGRPFKPCKTVRRILIAAWGEDGNQWIGRSMTLFCDPTVRYAGQEVGGIRVKAISDIQKSLIVKLAVTRGKKQEYRIEPLKQQAKPDYPADKFESAFDAMRDAVVSGKMTHEQVITKCEQTGNLSEEQRKRIRDIVPVTPDNLLDDDE